MQTSAFRLARISTPEQKPGQVVHYYPAINIEPVAFKILLSRLVADGRQHAPWRPPALYTSQLGFKDITCSWSPGPPLPCHQTNSNMPKPNNKRSKSDELDCDDPLTFIEDYCRRNLLPESGGSALEKEATLRATEAREEYKSRRLTGNDSKSAPTTPNNSTANTPNSGNHPYGTDPSGSSGTGGAVSTSGSGSTTMVEDKSDRRGLSPAQKYSIRLLNNRKSAYASKVYAEVYKRDLSSRLHKIDRHIDRGRLVETYIISEDTHGQVHQNILDLSGNNSPTTPVQDSLHRDLTHNQQHHLTNRTQACPACTERKQHAEKEDDHLKKQISELRKQLDSHDRDLKNLNARYSDEKNRNAGLEKMVQKLKLDSKENLQKVKDQVRLEHREMLQKLEQQVKHYQRLAQRNQVEELKERGLHRPKAEKKDEKNSSSKPGSTPVKTESMDVDDSQETEEPVEQNNDVEENIRKPSSIDELIPPISAPPHESEPLVDSIPPNSYQSFHMGLPSQKQSPSQLQSPPSSQIQSQVPLPPSGQRRLPDAISFARVRKAAVHHVHDAKRPKLTNSPSDNIILSPPLLPESQSQREDSKVLPPISIKPAGSASGFSTTGTGQSERLTSSDQHDRDGDGDIDADGDHEPVQVPTAKQRRYLRHVCGSDSPLQSQSQSDGLVLQSSPSFNHLKALALPHQGNLSSSQTPSYSALMNSRALDNYNPAQDSSDTRGSRGGSGSASLGVASFSCSQSQTDNDHDGKEETVSQILRTLPVQPTSSSGLGFVCSQQGSQPDLGAFKSSLGSDDLNLSVEPDLFINSQGTNGSLPQQVVNPPSNSVNPNNSLKTPYNSKPLKR